MAEPEAAPAPAPEEKLKEEEVATTKKLGLAGLAAKKDDDGKGETKKMPGGIANLFGGKGGSNPFMVMKAVAKFKRAGYEKKTKSFEIFEKQGREEKEAIAQIAEDFHAAQVREHPGFTSSDLTKKLDGKRHSLWDKAHSAMLRARLRDDVDGGVKQTFGHLALSINQTLRSSLGRTLKEDIRRQQVIDGEKATRTHAGVSSTDLYESDKDRRRDKWKRADTQRRDKLLVKELQDFKDNPGDNVPSYMKLTNSHLRQFSENIDHKNRMDKLHNRETRATSSGAPLGLSTSSPPRSPRRAKSPKSPTSPRNRKPKPASPPKLEVTPIQDKPKPKPKPKPKAPAPAPEPVREKKPRPAPQPKKPKNKPKPKPKPVEPTPEPKPTPPSQTSPSTKPRSVKTKPQKPRQPTNILANRPVTSHSDLGSPGFHTTQYPKSARYRRRKPQRLRTQRPGARTARAANTLGPSSQVWGDRPTTSASAYSVRSNDSWAWGSENGSTSPTGQWWTPSSSKGGMEGFSVSLQKPSTSPRSRGRMNASGYTALHYAASMGYAPVVQELLKRKRDYVAQTDSRGMTPRLCALCNGHTRIAEILKKAEEAYAARIDASQIPIQHTQDPAMIQRGGLAEPGAMPAIA